MVNAGLILAFFKIQCMCTVNVNLKLEARRVLVFFFFFIGKERIYAGNHFFVCFFQVLQQM